ncbi:hypothetical protein F4802DRAFT_593049 [Xylaria palmicola]|nr:hypothetical protein F4802DRAFT_593049 [Xylaria palmicola]
MYRLRSQTSIDFSPRLQLGPDTSSPIALDLVALDSIAPTYRWGPPGRALRRLRSTLNDFCGGRQQISDLLRTFQYAITVDAPEDEAREIPQMRPIYSNAACNLAASASNNPHGGLFRARDASAVGPGPVAAPSGSLRDEAHHVVGHALPGPADPQRATA